jgi:hypothetical protein
MAAMNPTTIMSRHESSRGSCRPPSRETNTAAEMPIGLPARIATSTNHVPAPALPKVTPAFARPKKNSMAATGRLKVCSNSFSVS